MKLPATTTIGSYPVFPSHEDIEYYQKMVEKGLSDEVTDPFLTTIEESVRDFAAAGIEMLSTGQTRADLFSLFLDPKYVKGIEWDGPQALVKARLSRTSSARIQDVRFARGVAPELLSLKEPITDAYTLARFAKISTGSYRDTRDLARDINRKLVIPELEDLQSSGAVAMVQLDSPNIASESSLPEYIKGLYEEVASASKLPLALHVCGDTTRLFRFLTTLPVDALELDFYHYPRLLEEVSRRNFDQSIGLGVTDSQSPRVESVDEVASLIRRGAKALGEEKIGWVHPHCGQRSLHRETAFEKNANLTMARDDVFFGEAEEPRDHRLGGRGAKAKGRYLVGVKRETGEIVLTFYGARGQVLQRYRSKFAEPLLHAVQNDSESLGLGSVQLAHLILELGRAAASLQTQPSAYRQRLTN
jgi:5-methyltetrahydropteroyltriglutamate--homocysteine methyltransferase